MAIRTKCEGLARERIGKGNEVLSAIFTMEPLNKNVPIDNLIGMFLFIEQLLTPPLVLRAFVFVFSFLKGTIKLIQG